MNRNTLMFAVASLLPMLSGGPIGAATPDAGTRADPMFDSDTLLAWQRELGGPKTPDHRSDDLDADLLGRSLVDDVRGELERRLKAEFDAN